MRSMGLSVVVIVFISIFCAASVSAGQSDSGEVSSSYSCVCISKTLQTAAFFNCVLPYNDYQCSCDGSRNLLCCQCPPDYEDGDNINACVKISGNLSRQVGLTTCNNEDKTPHKTKLIIGVVAGVGGGIIIVVIVIIGIVIIRRRRQKPSSAGKNTYEEPDINLPYEAVANIVSAHPPGSNDHTKQTFPERNVQSVSSGNNYYSHHQFYPQIVSNPAGFVSTSTDEENRMGYYNITTVTSPANALSPDGDNRSVSSPLTVNNSSETMLLDNHLYEDEATRTSRKDQDDITLVENDLYVKKR